MTYRFGTPAWYDAPSLFLDFPELNAIKAAKSELLKNGKPEEPGRIVAELSFGFWSSLLNKKYEYPHRQLWPHLLQRVFPSMPRASRTRHEASKRVNRIRELRNRVSHHERITHWALDQFHHDLIEAIGWISPPLQHLAKATDRFPTTFNLGWREARRKLLANSYEPEYII